MDATTLLEQDHRKVEDLFARYENEHDERTLHQICRELELHTTLEEELVYPRLAELDHTMVERAEEEHAEARELIAQIEAGDPDAAMLTSQLHKAMQQHVSQEESEAFPLMRERMSDDLETLGDQLDQRRRQLALESASGG